MNINYILAQVSVPLEDAGKFGWALVLVVLFFMSRSMVTKEDLLKATSEMREEIRDWAEKRFQTKSMCNAKHRFDGERTPDSD